MSLKNDLIAALHNQKLNTSASSLLLSNGIVERYFTTGRKVALSLVALSQFCIVVSLGSIGWSKNRLVTLSVLLLIASIGLQLDLNWFKDGARLQLADGHPDPALLSGNSTQLEALIANIYNAGYTLKQLSYDSYENGQLSNYTTLLYVGDYKLVNDLLGAHTINIEVFKSGAEQAFIVS